MFFTAVIGNPLIALCAALDRRTADAFTTVRRHVSTWWRQRERRALARATRIALSRLDDRTLHDLGLHRSEIPSVGEELLREGGRRRF